MEERVDGIKPPFVNTVASVHGILNTRSSQSVKCGLSLSLKGVNMKTILLSEFFIIIQIIVVIFMYEVIWKEFKNKIQERRDRKNAAKDKS